MRFVPEVRPALAAAFLLALTAAPALATNGWYLAGLGSESAGRGGANLAVAGQTPGPQANPAGLSHLIGGALSVDLQVLAPALHYGGDPLGNSIDSESEAHYLPSISYARGSAVSPWAWGVALITQGELGATFVGYTTPFATTDRTSSKVRLATLTPSVAFRASDRLSFGLSLNAGYSEVEFAFWPGTSFYSDGGTPVDPSDDAFFVGMDMTTPAKAYTTSVRGGALWRVSPALSLGAVYQTETTGDYVDGTLALNESLIDLGLVRYDAEVEGFAWPAQFGAGVEVRPAKRWMLAADVRRYLWKDSMKQLTVKIDSPHVPSPLEEGEVEFDFDWEDQWVLSAGAEFAAGEALTLRAGWNYGASPVPDATLGPLFPATTEQHATAGLSWKRAAHAVHFAAEHAFEATQTNLTADPGANPFGPGMTVDHSQWTFSLGYGRSF